MHDTNKKPHTSKKTARFACAYFTGFQTRATELTAAGASIAQLAADTPKNPHVHHT